MTCTPRPIFGRHVTIYLPTSQNTWIAFREVEVYTGVCEFTTNVFNSTWWYRYHLIRVKDTSPQTRKLSLILQQCHISSAPQNTACEKGSKSVLAELYIYIYGSMCIHIKTILSFKSRFPKVYWDTGSKWPTNHGQSVVTPDKPLQNIPNRENQFDTEWPYCGKCDQLFWFYKMV